MKTIHINESTFMRLMEEKEPLPFQTFYEEVVKFIEGLLKDPVGTKPSNTLVSYGLDGKTLRSKLLNKNIIKKDEKIDEPYDEEKGKKVSRYYVKYKVPREKFKDKLRNLHKELNLD